MFSKRKLKAFNKNLNKRISSSPKWVMRIYFYFLNLAKRRYYKNERLLMKNRLSSKSDQPSILFFTLHKCASTFIRDTLERFALEKEMVTINYSGLFNEKQQEKYYHDSKFINKVFRKSGFLYGAFRQYYPFRIDKRIKILLVLRDPRDVLTSHYFSTAFNHPLVEKEFLEKRERAQQQTIDEYVLEKLPIFKARYEKYIDNVLGKENVLFIKYEEMVEDFPNWLKKVLSFLELDENQDLMNTIISETSFEVNKEDPKEFKRSVKAGDHLRKLQKETIDYLNKDLSNVLTALEYDT